MPKINLLPWREELLAQRNQQFGIIAAIFAAVAVLIIVAVSFYYGLLIDNQKARNEYMRGEIAKLDGKIKAIEGLEREKERLLQRINAIQKLQTNRTEIVHLFDETVRRIPDGVFLTSIKQDANRLTMNGIAESNTRVSEFIRNIEKSVWMTSPRIEEIKRNKGSSALARTNSFILQLQQSRPRYAGQEGGGS